MSLSRSVLAAVILLAAALPARAQGVDLRFHDGLVTLHARNAPLRSILAEWGRLGGATIVNAERIGGSPLTLELNDVPERQALDVLLRGVSGYLLGPRSIPSPSAAVFDRILILPTSAAPRATPAPATAQRPPLRMPQLAPDPNEPEDDPADLPAESLADNDPEPEPEPRPRQPRDTVPLRFPQPIPTPNATDSGATPGAQPAVPGNPFGVPFGATSRPGVVTPLPQQQQEEPGRRPDPDP